MIGQELGKMGHNTNEPLPDGYTMTELGPLPEEWQVVRLGEVFEIRQGKSLSPKSRSGPRMRPFLRTANVLWGRLDLSNVDQMHFDESEEHRLALKPGDLLVCEGGDIGRTAIWEGQLPLCLYQNHLHRLRGLREDVSPFFYMYWMQAAWTLLGLYGGSGNKTTIPNLSQSRLASFPIPLPPLPEQRAIAHVLRTVQQAKETRERVAAALKQLKKSLMQHLFTYGPVPVDQADQVPLQETEIGALPAHWQVVRLGEVTEVKGGKRLPKGESFFSKRTPYPYIRVVDFKNNTVDTKNLKYLTPEQHEILKRYIITKDDVYISIAGTIGEVGTIPPELDGAHLTENAARIIPNQEKIQHEFLAFALACDIGQKQIQMRVTKTSQPKLGLVRIRDIPIPLPPLPEQREIARILRTVDQRIEAEEASVRALETLFKTLLHELMTAKRRLPRELVMHFQQEETDGSV